MIVARSLRFFPSRTSIHLRFIFRHSSVLRYSSNLVLYFKPSFFSILLLNLHVRFTFYEKLLLVAVSENIDVNPTSITLGISLHMLYIIYLFIYANVFLPENMVSIFAAAI